MGRVKELDVRIVTKKLKETKQVITDIKTEP